MDNRDVVHLVASGYEWLCPQCEEMQTAETVPGTPDLTCQSCGANYKHGDPVHCHADDQTVSHRQWEKE